MSSECIVEYCYRTRLWGKLMFSICLFSGGGGIPLVSATWSWYFPWGYPWSLVPGPFLGGYPWSIPGPFLGRGYPRRACSLRVCPVRPLVGGYPIQAYIGEYPWTGQGSPPVQDRSTPPPPPPRRAGYAGGTPLVVTQEDFLVLMNLFFRSFRQRSTLSAFLR